MGALIFDRRSILLFAIFPSLAFGLLNDFWLDSIYRQGVGWFYLGDILQWIVVPGLVWLFILHPAGIKPKDFGLDFAQYRQRPFETLGLFLFVALLLWVAYEPIKNIAYRYLWKYAGTFGYGNLVPASFPWHVFVVAYFAATAAVVEEVVFRGLSWAYVSLVVPKSNRNFLYITITSLLFAATHSEQGPHGMIAALSFGIVAASLYSKLQNLWPLVVGHFVVDLLSFW